MSELFESTKEFPADMPQVQLFTDGACLGNPGPGGWAYILRCLASGEEREVSGGEDNTTNNRMEMLAVINGLEALKEPARVLLVADSQYVLKGMKEWMPGWKACGWRTASKKPVKNVDLWQRLDVLMNEHDIKSDWTKGHAGHAENERCDELASAEAERVKYGM